jgi:hypothetical protein
LDTSSKEEEEDEKRRPVAHYDGVFLARRSARSQPERRLEMWERLHVRHAPRRGVSDVDNAKSKQLSLYE